MPSLLHEILFREPVLGGLKHLRIGQHRPACGEDHRGRGRNVLEFVGDDVDFGGEQLQRLDIGIFRAGRVLHHVERRRIRIRRKHLARRPRRAAASASIRPNCPPPRIPMVSPGFSFTGLKMSLRSPLGARHGVGLLLAPGRKPGRQAASLSASTLAASRAALIAPALPIAKVPTGIPAGICTIE